MTPSRRPSAAVADRATKNQQSRPVAKVVCGYCRGTGKDPFGVMSPLSTCQVCGGTGRHKLHLSKATCNFCAGSGIHPGSRQTCLPCKGVGIIEAQEGAANCPDCKGSGKCGVFYCTTCKGQGIL